MKTRLPSTFSAIVLTAAILILAAYLGNALFLYARHAATALRFPFPLEYGEGPVLDQTLRLASGENIYRNSIAVPPYTVSNDPPLYMLLQAPFVRIFGPAFWYGRGISVLSLILTVIFLSLTLYQLTQDWIASLISGLLLFAVPYFWNGSVVDRVDALALALSWAGLYAIVRWPDRRRGLVMACLAFSAAVFTQVTYALAAPITALAWLLQTNRPRRGVELLAGFGGICLVLFLGMNTLTRGGFFFNIVTAQSNIWNYQQVAGKLIEISLNSFFLGLVALIFFIAERLDAPTRSWPFVLPYFIAAVLVTILVGKAGENDGSMYELSAALCLASGAAIAWVKSHWIKAVGLALITMQVSSFFAWTAEQYQPKFAEKIASRAEITQLAAIVRQAGSPILADEYNGLLPLAGKRLYYQPFEFNQLAQAGLWDPDLLIKDISQHKFAYLFIYFPKDIHITQTRWPGKIYASIFDYYVSTDTLAYNLVFHPKE